VESYREQAQATAADLAVINLSMHSALAIDYFAARTLDAEEKLLRDTVAQLGTAMPQAGGFYIYARRAFGPAVGFATGWADWLNNCAVADRFPTGGRQPGGGRSRAARDWFLGKACAHGSRAPGDRGDL